MQIVMLAPFGMRPKGTLSARMLPLAQALQQRGHRVTIVAPPVQNREDAGTRRDYGGVPVIHTHAPALPGAAALAMTGGLLWETWRARPDLVHLFKPKGFGGLAALGLRAVAPRLPLVVDCDDREGRGGWNELLAYPQLAKALFAWQEADLPRRAAAVTVASRTLESLVWASGVAPERVVFLPNGSGALPAPLLRPEAAQQTMLLYTRFWEFELPWLVAALVAIVQGAPTSKLVVVGAGEQGEEEQLARLVARAGIAEAVQIHGWAAPERLPSLFAQARIALAPISDTLINRARGMAKLVELMGSGFAIVASDVGIARDYLGQAALLSDPREPGQFAADALRLLRNPQLTTELAAAAQQRAEQFAWSRLACQAEIAYDMAMRSR